MKFCFAFLFLLLSCIISSFGQADSSKILYTHSDSVKAKKEDLRGLKITSDSAIKVLKASKKLKDPRRASLLAAVFPGAGQIYNRSYWKLPIVWGAAFTLGYYIGFNNQEYVKNRDWYLLVQNGKANRTGYSTEQLVRLREYWRRNRDFLIIISALTYLLNIADAAVDAHFSSFDVSDDLSLNWKPEIYVAGRQPVFGLGLVLNFK